MKHGCAFCLSPDHTISTCSKVAAFRVATEHGVIDPMTTEELNDQVALRMIAYRTYAGQLERLLREASLVIPAEVQSLNPDRCYQQ